MLMFLVFLHVTDTELFKCTALC